ncbi:hypothetical protein PSTT_02957 [Puccinia striiformis]|uniref:Uncharacterized protein n=1 Tax=Puccinia striiformis TaxID=27350 RepID=A0A2S4VY75_9BASI|nr:hypothetical protein PSTT_02957 [Puccinia striiformis]
MANTPIPDVQIEELECLISNTMKLLHQQRGVHPSTQTRSFELAIEAYNQSLGPYKIGRDPTPNSLKLGFTPVLHPVRQMTMTLSSVSSQPQLNLEQLLKDEIVPLINKFELSRTDLMRFYEDFLNDPVFLLSDSIEKPVFEFLLDGSHN